MAIAFENCTVIATVEQTTPVNEVTFVPVMAEVVDSVQTVLICGGIGSVMVANDFTTFVVILSSFAFSVGTFLQVR